MQNTCASVFGMDKRYKGADHVVGEEREQEEEGGWEDGRSVINWQTEGV